MFFSCKLFAGNFHFKRLLLLTQYFYRLNGYLSTTGQIYGFSGALPNLCYLMYINGKTPAFVSGVICSIGAFCFLYQIDALGVQFNYHFYPGFNNAFILARLTIWTFTITMFHSSNGFSLLSPNNQSANACIPSS